MKNLVVVMACAFASVSFSQIASPRLSPEAKISQQVGLTDITIEYSRPSKRGRVVFGDVVPMNEVWRTGANKNSMIEFSDAVVFGKDTVKAGKYAIFVKPGEAEWSIYLYSEIENWGTPEEWKAENVVLEVKAKTQKLNDVVETFTIAIESISLNDAVLSFAWDKTKVSTKFMVPTRAKMDENIAKVMAGPSVADYYRAADYKYAEKTDLKDALVWINKSIEMSGESVPFYVLRKKALIQAEMGDFKGATTTANLSLEAAKKAGNDNYVKMNEASIKEWSKK